MHDNHYKKLQIQPIEIHNKYNLNYTAQAFLKYVSRHQFKNGKEDLEKATFFCIPQTIKEIDNGVLQYTLSYGMIEDIDRYCLMNGFWSNQRGAIMEYFKAILCDETSEALMHLSRAKKELALLMLEY